MTSQFQPAPIPDGRIEVGGKPHMADAKGRLVPVSDIKASDLLIDEQVRKTMGFAVALSEQIARFKGHCFAEIAAIEALLAQEYGVSVGGAKGNMRFYSHDRLFYIEVQVADRIDFGPEIQIAKQLLDECIVEWADGTRAELRALIMQAFNADSTGKIDRRAVSMLQRVPSEDPRWNRAMDAIRDAMIQVGSRTYIRFYRRETQNSGWQNVTLDLASA